jgi:CelD/BcsL family acetyltransferase involved in cellulose biosynthesis
MCRISVTVCSTSPSIDEHWGALVESGSASVFLDPAALRAVHATGFADLRVLLAWNEAVQPKKLVGVWAFQQRGLPPLWPASLAAPAYDYSFSSVPVVDPACIEETIRAFLDAIATDSALPKVIRLKYLDAESAVYHALIAALAARGSVTLTLSERERPFASRASGAKQSGSTRKKMRQDWNRLSALGAVDIVNEKTPSAVADAFEVFLAMEAKSWKGANGTALLCDDEDAAFVRKLAEGLAARQSASVALLRVAGQPIAAQVLFYCGTTAYTWKTAFDAEFAKYSPGALLVDRMTEQLLSGDFEAIESCSPEGGFMTQLWSGRRSTVDMLVDVGTRRSLSFTMALAYERAYGGLRQLRNRLRTVSWPAFPKAKGLAPSP